MFKPETEPEEVVPRLVARVQLPSQSPTVNGGPPKLNAITQADINRLNADKTIENKIMNQRDGWGAKPSDKNRPGGPASFASLNEGLTFAALGASPYSNSNYLKSRQIG
jgi:hypothetical protein